MPQRFIKITSILPTYITDPSMGNAIPLIILNNILKDIKRFLPVVEYPVLLKSFLNKILIYLFIYLGV